MDVCRHFPFQQCSHTERKREIGCTFVYFRIEGEDKPWLRALDIQQDIHTYLSISAFNQNSAPAIIFPLCGKLTTKRRRGSSRRRVQLYECIFSNNLRRCTHHHHHITTTTPPIPPTLHAGTSLRGPYLGWGCAMKKSRWRVGMGGGELLTLLGLLHRVLDYCIDRQGHVYVWMWWNEWDMNWVWRHILTLPLPLTLPFYIPTCKL